jgi:ABC-type dipeptide/oligopeptide/nickel transport system ATPase component
MPAGCRFAARCPFADARCRSTPPPLLDLGKGHRSACWKAPLDAELLLAESSLVAMS